MHRMDVGRVLRIFGLGCLALFAQTVQAQGPLNYFKNYFVTGDYVVGGVGLTGQKLSSPVTGAVAVTGNITLNSVPCTSGPGLFASVVPCTANGAVPADVIAAFLYWQTIEGTTTPSSAIGSYASSFNAASPVNPFVGLALGNPSIAACAATGGGSGAGYIHNYRADVLKYLPVSPTANVRLANGTQTFTLVSGNTSAQFVGATLVVVYRLVTPGNPKIAPLRSVVIYDGAFTGTSSPTLALNQTMGGFYQASTNPAAHMTQIVGNGQKGFSETLTVNGSIPQGVPSDPLVGAQGAKWDNYTYNINLSPNASSVQTDVALTKDCLSWAAIITSTNVQDSDFDGLLDIWETSGLALNPGVRNDGTIAAPTPATFGTCIQYPNSCLNLHAMGASPSVPDIFMQIDWMQGTYGAPHVHNPQLAALNMVGAAFQAHGINLHFDVGSSGTYQGQKSAYIIPTTYAQGGNVVEESGNLLCPNTVTEKQGSTCAFPSQSSEFSVLGWKSGFDAIKNGDSVLGLPQLFATNRKDVFHYALFGHAIAATTPLSAPLAGSVSGVGDLPGGDLMVTLGLWRSDIPAVDQVGSELEQAGTLMHELGHNLDLKHGGWNNTPVCMPDYPSVMNYLYQVSGLTDASGNEHIDYSYGLELPLLEEFLSSSIPMGIQTYKVRYFGPLNSATNTPGQASQVDCNGQILSQSLTGEGQYVRLQGTSVSTPDWSNGTAPLGSIITKGLDINYDGTLGQTFRDSPDWVSLNLQQVGARPNANGLSLNVGISDIGISDIGISDIGISDIGISDIGISDIGISDIGISDIGTAQLGQDALGDQDYSTFVLSGVTPLSALTATVTPAPPTPASASYAGGTGTLLTWTPPSAGQVTQYNIYRCNASAGACTPTAPAIANVPGGTATPSYTDNVNFFAGGTCPATATCYNTTYNYYVTAVVVVGTLSNESSPSNTVSSEVNHLFVIANNQTVAYGSANPTPTFTVYGNVSSSLAASAVTCVYTPSNPKNGGTYPITCSGPATSSGTDGVTYNAAYLTYTPGTLTITPRTLTVTAVASTKVYNGSTNSSAIPTVTGSLIPGDTITWSENYDNPNVGTNHVMTPSGTATGTTSLSSYTVKYVTYTGGVITAAPLTGTAQPAARNYGAANPTFTAAYTGFVGTDTASIVTGTLVCTTTAVANSPVSPPTYPITCSGQSAPNYSVSYVAGALTITAAPLTGTIQNNSRAYGAANPAFSALYTGFMNGQTASIVTGTLACTTTAVANSPVSPPTYPISCSGQSAPNYAITYSGALTITPAAASVTPNAATKVYGAPDPTFTGTLTGFLASDNVTATYARTAGQTVAGSPYSISATLSPTGVLSNYAITYNKANFTITPANTTTTISNVSPSPAPAGQPVTVTVTVAPVAPGTGTPTGSVTVNSSPAGATCTVASVSGTGSCMLTFTGSGPESLTATYTSGSLNFSGSSTAAATPLTVNSLPMFSTTSLPPATLNFPYQPQQLMATGGSGTYTSYAVTGGSLPAGLTLSPSGVLSGTPTAAGTNPVTISVTDSLMAVGSQSYTISTGFALVGSGAVNGAGVQLTSGVGQSGAAWAGTEQSVVSGFSANFQFQITPIQGVTPADGLAFVIQGSSSGASAIGGGGGDIGYAGITNSLAVEFDTYDDSSYPIYDPNGNHIAIISNGTAANNASHSLSYSVVAMTNSNLGITLTDGAVHNVKITYTGGSSGTLTVSVDGSTIVSASNLNLQTLLGLPSNGLAWVGFTGGAGAGGENGDIYNWSYSAGPAPVALTIGALPNGQFNSPYAPITPSAGGGAAPYTVSLAPNAVVPVGMTFDISGSTCGTAGSICGTPAQAGQWQIPFMVTDSSASPVTQTVTVPLTIGLATGYAGGSNCTMPYPATPLYYAGATGWTLTGASLASTISTSSSAGSAALVASEMTFVPGNVLTGCLTGQVSNPLTSGVYTLSFNIAGGPSAFAMPLTVVGQDTQDNGSVNISSGTSLPPAGNQQGVLSPGANVQPNIGNPYEFNTDAGFTGNFLFGFSGLGVDPDGCSSGFSDGLQLSGAPSTPGRYDLLFDGTTANCSVSVFPTSPAPIVFASIDVIGTTVNVPATGGATITNVVLSGSGATVPPNTTNVLEFESGSAATIQVTVSFNYSIVQDPSCSGCVDQIAVGLNSDPGPQFCAYSGNPSGGVSGATTMTIMVPNTPGRYYLGIDRTEESGCVSTWPSGPPPPSAYIGIVDVWPQVSY